MHQESENFFFKKERLPPSGFSSHAGYSKCIKKANFFFMKERFPPSGFGSQAGYSKCIKKANFFFFYEGKASAEWF